MNHDELMRLTNEAEVKAYLREVGREHGRSGLLQVANGLMDFSDQINQRTLWILEVCREMK